ncbi:hypothetical protein PUP75_10475 [Pseudomonas chlororaphis]|uniref:hypothetical protein n=1 Tax=Pseudomonas chlororaphis TaxID=587753 RepID=UPI002367B4EF|nr:hypothetical protein [Pseudomonas chlororaphis]WDH55196.1 hypothetical protein PUP75_10475 [Pseudomonas chlororaphis]
MAKIKSPATISTEFDIDPEDLFRLGIIDTQLASDTNLFIDPLLLEGSAHPEINTGAATAYEQRFELIIKLLRVSEVKGDLPWRKVEKLFKFSEISWTCLGYSSSVRGAGFGKELTTHALDTAAQIVRLGITDIDFFMGLSLFEEGIGADRISDMTTNIIIKDLVRLTQRVNKDLKIPSREFKVEGELQELPVNPYTDSPLIFVPTDIVRDLPIATDWSDISRAVKENEELRERVSGKIGQIWSTMTKKDKANIKNAALSSKESFEQLLEMLREVPLEPYDFTRDENGESFWVKLTKIGFEYPVKFKNSTAPATAEEAVAFVEEMILQFQDLIENKGIWKELWSDDKKPRREKAAQRLFFTMAYSYCKANNLDITPEADAGNGPVDFKFSSGFNNRVLVEIKLSTNSLLHGYQKQLEIYKTAEDTDHGIYLVIDVGGLGQKYAEVQRARREAIERGEKTSKIFLIDGNRKASASKR